ncbi:MAG TPA: hypothetical protein VM369_07465 [Candidatus Binatia bacterium]|nr:hypothetical protein [Candidatus Binatia bacterium]
MARELTLLQSALQRLRVTRSGGITQLVVDGQGAALVPTADFSPVQKWAHSRTAAPNALQSMQRVIDKLEVVIVRPGTTFAATRGSAKPLGDLLKMMKSSGFDINEWAIPNEVKNPPPELGSAEAKVAMEEKKAKLAALDARNKAVLDRLDEAKKYEDPQGKS